MSLSSYFLPCKCQQDDWTLLHAAPGQQKPHPYLPGPVFVTAIQGHFTIGIHTSVALNWITLTEKLLCGRSSESTGTTFTFRVLSVVVYTPAMYVSLDPPTLTLHLKILSYFHFSQTLTCQQLCATQCVIVSNMVLRLSPCAIIICIIIHSIIRTL